MDAGAGFVAEPQLKPPFLEAARGRLILDDLKKQRIIARLEGGFCGIVIKAHARVGVAAIQNQLAVDPKFEGGETAGPHFESPSDFTREIRQRISHAGVRWP